MRKVFLSSTSRDLATFREIACKTIEGLDNFHCVKMEDFGARDAIPEAVCRQKIAESDVMVLIVGLCHGSTPAGGEDSFTVQEYKAATDLKLPRLVFMSQDGTFYSGFYREDDELWLRQQEFRALISKERTLAIFSNPGELGGAISQAVRNWEQDNKFVNNIREVTQDDSDKSENYPFDHSPVRDASLGDLNLDKVKRFLESDPVLRQRDYKPGVSLQEQLSGLGLLREARPIRGSLLCFGINLQKWFPGSSIRCFDWQGETSIEGWNDEDEFFGDLLSQFESSFDFLRKNLRVKRTISTEGRTEELEIPPAVLEEALANAFIHRDYARTESVRVQIFSDRIEISSPGRPPLPMTVDLVGTGDPVHRNPMIARIFYLHGYVERAGTGIQRMQVLMSRAGLPEPAFELSGAEVFRVTLTRRQTGAEEVNAGREISLPVQVEIAESDLRTSYLHRIIEQAGYMAVSGIDPTLSADRAFEPLSLSTIYVGVSTLSRSVTDDRSQVSEGMERRSALEYVNRHERVVILGEPGSGKSTLLNFMAICMAGEILGSTTLNLKILVSSLLGSTISDREVHKHWNHGALLPIRIVLRDFAARGLPRPGEPASARHLWDFLKTDLSEAGLSAWFPFLHRHLVSQGALILLDGLDEIPEAENRREQVRQAIESFVQGLGKSRVLITSRTYAYRNQDWRLRGFVEVELAPFSNEQIDCFVDRWYVQIAAMGRLKPESARERAESLKRAIQGSERLRELAERPLLLVLAASLHAWRGGSLPERREELYSDAVNLLLDTWERQRTMFNSQGSPVLLQPSLAEFLSTGREKVRSVLEEIAWEAHKSQPDAMGTSDIEEGQLVMRLWEISRNPQANPALLMEYLRDRTGLLEARGVGVYTFPHRTLQEYLAACYLTGESFPDLLAELAREDPARWREVVLLAGAKAARGASSAVWQLAGALCFGEPEYSESSMADAWGAQLAGQVVAESADLSRVSLSNQLKLEHLRRWLTYLLGDSRFPAVERALAGRTLAQLGDPRPEVMAVDSMEICRVPAGTFYMGSADDDLEALDNEKPFHKCRLSYDYLIARYPVTVAQFREYIEASRINQMDSDRFKRLSNGPAVLVSWYEAQAFCRWLTERWLRTGRLESGWIVSLPSEAEWEKTARGSDGRIYPWGNEAISGRANFSDTGINATNAVGCFSSGRGPFGAEEMSGNVWEWTRSLWGTNWERTSFFYPYNPADGRERSDVSPEVLRILRGGSYVNRSRNIRCASRTGMMPSSQVDGVGFRIVLIKSSVLEDFSN